MFSPFKSDVFAPTIAAPLQVQVEALRIGGPTQLFNEPEVQVVAVGLNRDPLEVRVGHDGPEDEGRLAAAGHELIEGEPLLVDVDVENHPVPFKPCPKPVLIGTSVDDFEERSRLGVPARMSDQKRSVNRPIR